MINPSRASAAEYKSNPSLQKGQACAYCRRRRIRCDGRRPVCGPCLRGSRPDDCEYTDNQTRSRAEILEEDIIRVERRIYELEHPAEVGESVFLHHPYAQPRPPAQMPSLLQALDSLGTVSAPPDLPAVDVWWNSPEPPNTMTETLIDTFLPYASDFGFFLEPIRFRQDALLPLPIGHHSRPSPALLAAVYLVGIILSDSPALRIHENVFIARALSSLPISLSGTHPRKAIHALQAEIILSNYFYASGRLLEGRYHTSAAVSLALSSAFLRSKSPTAPLHHTCENLEAYWTTIILDKSWAVALAMPPNVTEESCPGFLELPWPADGALSSTSQSGLTVRQFLEGTQVSTGVASPQTLLAKATVLWERANNLVVGRKPDMNAAESNDFYNTFNRLDTRIHDFNCSLALSAPDPDARALLVARSLARAAMLQLHGPFAQTDSNSKQKCRTAAKSILVLAAGADSTLRASVFINPILSAIWVVAAEVAVDEIAALRASRPAWAPDVPIADEAALVGLFARGIEAMHRFERWPLTKYYLDKIDQAYRAV